MTESPPATADPQLQDFLYVANSGSDNVSLIDTLYKTTTPVGVGRSPNHMAINPAGTRLYVTNSTGNVSVVDTETKGVTTIAVGRLPSGVAVNPAGTRVYVANSGEGSVSVIDTTTDPPSVTTIAVGKWPTGVAINPAGTRVYVTDYGASNVSVIDADTNNKVATIGVKSFPKSVAITPGGTRAYVTHYGAANPNLVSVIDTTTNKVTDTIRAGDHPIAVAINPAGTFAYVANNFSDNVSVIDTTTNKETTTIKVGQSPSGVAINTAGTRAYVTNNRSDTVSVINTATNEVATTINVGRLPIGVAVLDKPVDRTAIVSLGDSYISGEAGRWQGNAVPASTLGDRWGTDRAAYNCTKIGLRCSHNARRVYGESFDNGCNRSDSAEIQSASINVLRRINLACSGAKTINVIGADAGGKTFKGEPPQADQLRHVARHYNVQMVVLSIGGNDLGFASVLEKCVKRWQKQHGIEHCHVDQAPVIREGLVQTKRKVEQAVSEIQRAMTNAGSYRFVLQSYPSPIPPGDQNRYHEFSDSRFNVGGCPMFNDDSDWARNTVIPEISDMLREVARAHDLEFLDLRNLFDGHEVCANRAQQATAANSLQNPLPGDISEWTRFLVVLESQGQSQESIHPNYYGQQAIGTCLTKLWDHPAEKNHTCTGTPGRGPSEVSLTSSRW
ncbi:beta-propeller fold lactonase family protein [Nonomuraea sp. NEAU-A123]|uniref:beta-propeller fold lactonase family protein n=1 Tax=Nonomuraea sp. NEAU-A123 TaxID=2839649 RepID=UPI001BE49F8E|nr:GDSL-type esterase/lipase family protein [Nonomuraea sp. NEAU-A123]MBT2233275.1 beta-propeller fold lactonase family protein [Nonomuraea sp. NEAU-A123]